MADRKRLERIELLIGTGRVLKGLTEVATVRYRVEVFQEKIESITGSGTHIIDGLKDIRGTIDPVGASIGTLFDKGTLTLVFEDGRKMDFMIAHSDIMANSGSIANASGAGIY